MPHIPPKFFTYIDLLALQYSFATFWQNLVFLLGAEPFCKSVGIDEHADTPF